MKVQRTLPIVLVVLVTAVSVTVFGQPMPKKLIEYGWGVRQPSYVSEHIREMEKKPFDGIILGDHANFSDVFWHKELDEKRVAADLKAMASIKWEKFTDNFYMMWARSNMDWFSEEDWAPEGWVLRNARLCAKAAKVGGCVGVCFDAEWFWGRSPWTYKAQPHHDEKSFAEFEAMVRKRGAQFMDAMEEEYPGLVVHTFFLLSYFRDVAIEPDPAKRSKLLEPKTYALLPAFVNGMLDAADPDTTITDGNEKSYYYKGPLDYYKGYHIIRQLSQWLVPPDLRYKYRSQVQCAHAVFMDVLCDTFRANTPSTYMTPDERAKFVEHNVYWALKTSDRYVWFYSEYINWWTGENVPPYLAGAIQSARRKIARGEPLGFEIRDFWQRAQDKLVAVLYRPITPRTAKIPRLAKGSRPPVIDGKLNDAAWKEKVALAPFVPFVTARDYDLVGKTRVWMTFDEENLYVGFLCKDPEMDKVSAFTFQDEQKRGNDRVEVAISADAKSTAYYHIMVDCDNARWDSLTKAGKEIYGKDSSWTGKYRNAARKEKDQWVVEVAIPWETLGMEAPGAGDRLKGNLLRWRHARPDGLQEFSSWSESRRARYVEAENFGTWVFE